MEEALKQVGIQVPGMVAQGLILGYVFLQIFKMMMEAHKEDKRALVEALEKAIGHRR